MDIAPRALADGTWREILALVWRDERTSGEIASKFAMRADRTFGDTSIDFGEIGPDGRLIKMAGFLGPAPQMAH